jgi:CBS domain-containing protein/predicted transcriptional regulator
MSTVDDKASNLHLKKDKQRKEEVRWQRDNSNKAEMIKYFYRYSDYSMQAIADHLSLPLNKVQKIVDELIKSEALEAFIEESTTRVEKIMSEDVISLDYSKSVVDAAALMAKNEIGSIIVTKDSDKNDNGNQARRKLSVVSKPYGIVTERDMVRRLDPVVVGSDFYFRNALLGHICSHPLIAAHRGLTVYDATKIMIKNRIRKLPILNSRGDKVIGIVTTTDLAMFLSPSKRPGLVSSLLQAMSRGRSNAAKKRTTQKKLQSSKPMDTSNSERDTRTPIIIKILKSSVDGTTKRKILKATALTHEQLRRITAELVDQELLRYVDANRLYITSDKGHQFLNQNRSVKDVD